MNKLAGIILGTSLMTGVVLSAVGCGKPPAATAELTSLPDDIPVQTAEAFVRSSSTFSFGDAGDIIGADKAAESPDGTVIVTVRYQTGQPGHGDRTGQVLAQVVTDHSARVTVEGGKVTSATCDGIWDMVSDAAIQGQ